MKMFNMLFAAILMPHMHTTSTLQITTGFQGIKKNKKNSYSNFAISLILLPSRHTAELPMLQLAFQYTVIVPPTETNSKYTLKRRLRIRTMQFGVAHNFNELYDSVDPEVVLSILVHKVI